LNSFRTPQLLEKLRPWSLLKCSARDDIRWPEETRIWSDYIGPQAQRLWRRRHYVEPYSS